MKRAFDLTVALVGLVVCSPFLLAVMLAIWAYDRGSPFYVARRMARGRGTFPMVKFRTMVVNADRTGVSSTAAGDQRITPVGRLARRFKFDEIIQLWNVLKGDMSLVGPRPQVKADADLYTDEEKRLLTVRPGITDLASIVFADEGDILEGSSDPDLRYSQIIRPWKSRLGLLYIEKRSLYMDLWIVVLTALVIVSRRLALQMVQGVLRRWDADPLLMRMAERREPLLAYPPPGATEVLTKYPRG
jgi:lipopolysaccharide/colanic/teichoic acid biosynthesis glycosyltransferase